MKLTKRKIIFAMAAIVMSATALTSAMSAAALEGEGQSYTGNADYIGTYLTTDYFGNSAFEVSFRYESFDPNGTYVDEETGVVKTIDYNDTFQFLVFDSSYSGWDKTIAGPNGVNLTTPLTSDEARDVGFYVSISIHNDGGKNAPGKWLDISLPNGSDEFKAVLNKFKSMWTQIAEKFVNYDQTLVFEGMNEVMVGDAYNRNQLTDAQFENAYANINELNQGFVDSVRGTGNDANDDRVLVVPGYNTDIDMTVAGYDEGVFYMPADTATDRLALRIGYFDPSSFTLSGSYGNETTWDINGQYGQGYMISELTKVANYGVPIFVGEYGAYFKNNIPEVAEYVGAFNASAKAVQTATGTSYATEYWDNGVIGINNTGGTGLIDRRFNIVTPTGTTIINAILNPKPAPPDITLIENDGPFTGDNTLIGTYYRSLYSLRNKLQIKFKYNVLYSTRVDENGKEVDVDFNDTFEFVAFNSNSSEQKVTQVGPKGIDGKSDITPSFNQTYTVTIPISTIENKLNKTPYGIRLQTGDIGKSQVSIS